jgi:hypothetical protein
MELSATPVSHGTESFGPSHGEKTIDRTKMHTSRHAVLAATPTGVNLLKPYSHGIEGADGVWTDSGVW